MDLSYLKKIIRLVENSDVDEVEIEEEGKKVRVARNRNSPIAYAGIPAPFSVAPQASAPAPLPPSSEAVSAPAAKAEPKYHEIRSPIVGTFYRAPAPDAEAYVEVGQKVSQGQVLCIVEAMKLMNEIESDVGGSVVKIVVENGKPVEYNQLLFLVDTQ
ncbi:MAG TPA: acetyl-CoA carboxylase biotin carboxyl carrier protein [Bacteroidota bacterium]|nr:acetyl-CoA carboxylase biotin carboxyl carrier protein [Bacteroidota bacterium]